MKLILTKVNSANPLIFKRWDISSKLCWLGTWEVWVFIKTKDNSQRQINPWHGRKYKRNARFRIKGPTYYTFSDIARAMRSKTIHSKWNKRRKWVEECCPYFPFTRENNETFYSIIGDGKSFFFKLLSEEDVRVF